MAEAIVTALQRHRLVGFDTSLFIYHLERAARYWAQTVVVLDALAEGRFRAVTSVLTLMEVAVRPLQLKSRAFADNYEAFVGTYPNLRVVDIDSRTARRAAELRAAYRLRPADALHVAACLQSGATAFLTNDRDLRRLTEIEVLLLDDFVEG